MEKICRQNGDLIECLVKVEKGWMGTGVDMSTGMEFIQMRKGEDGVYTPLHPDL